MSSITPDGKHVAISVQSGTTGEDVLIVTLDGSAPIRTFANSAFDELAPAFSPDGKWIAYASTESGRLEVYVQSFPGSGGKWQVSPDGGMEPQWARNGRELFYRNGRKVMAVALQTTPSFAQGAAQMLFEGDYEVGHRNHTNYDVAPDGRFLMLKAQVDGRPPPLHVIVNLATELRQRVPSR